MKKHYVGRNYVKVEPNAERPEPNTLWVSSDPETLEIIICHPQLLTDQQGTGYLTFTAEQAQGLANLLLSHAAQMEALAEIKNRTRQR